MARRVPVITHPDVVAKQGANRRHPRPRPRDKVMKLAHCKGRAGSWPAMKGGCSGGKEILIEPKETDEGIRMRRRERDGYMWSVGS